MTDKTKADLAQENEDLKTQLAQAVEERSQLEDSFENLSDRVDMMASAMEEKKANGGYDPEPESVYDPFDEQNPHTILSHPNGWVLSWKNPDYRAHRGWRGWIPIEYDDEYGQELHKYLADPPARMEGMAQIDNYVRRGTDSILCRLPADIWEARQNKRVRKSHSAQAATKDGPRRGHNYSTYGEGAVQRTSGDAQGSYDPTSYSERTDLIRRD